MTEVMKLINFLVGLIGGCAYLALYLGIFYIAATILGGGKRHE